MRKWEEYPNTNSKEADFLDTGGSFSCAEAVMRVLSSFNLDIANAYVCTVIHIGVC